MSDQESIDKVEQAAMNLYNVIYGEICQPGGAETTALKNRLLCFEAGSKLMLYEIRLVKNAINQVENLIEY